MKRSSRECQAESWAWSVWGAWQRRWLFFEEDATNQLFAKSTYAAVILIFRIIIPRIVFIVHLSSQSCLR
jgi:hypothetical protein